MKNKLYNLSKYATAYFDENKELYGVQISGYANEDDDTKTYVSLWASAKDKGVTLLQAKDGDVILCLKMAKMETRIKGAKKASGKEAEKEVEKAKQAKIEKGKEPLGFTPADGPLPF